MLTLLITSFQRTISATIGLKVEGLRVTTKIAHLTDRLFPWMVFVRKPNSEGIDSKEWGGEVYLSARDNVISCYSQRDHQVLRLLYICAIM